MCDPSGSRLGFTVAVFVTAEARDGAGVHLQVNGRAGRGGPPQPYGGADTALGSSLNESPPLSEGSQARGAHTLRCRLFEIFKEAN